MPERIQLVVFDLDGTLVDAYPAIVESVNYLMKILRLPRRNSLAIRRAVGWGDKNLLKPFIEAHSLEKALLIYRRHHKDALKRQTRFLPGAKRVLSYLKKSGYTLALASNRPARFTNIILKHLGMSKYFRVVLCGDQLKNPKPHPDILLKILKKLSIPRRNALFAGDMTVDVLTGKRAGVKTVAIVTGSSTRAELKRQNPFCVIEKISELLDILRRLEERLKQGKNFC